MSDLDGKIEWRGVGNTRPVDAAGRLPRGEAFKSFAECKQLLVAELLERLVRRGQRVVLASVGGKPGMTANGARDVEAGQSRRCLGGRRGRQRLAVQDFQPGILFWRSLHNAQRSRNARERTSDFNKSRRG